MNPVVKTTPLRLYPGWVVREYEQGQFDASHIIWPALSPGFTSFKAATRWVAAQLS